MITDMKSPIRQSSRMVLLLTLTMLTIRHTNRSTARNTAPPYVTHLQGQGESPLAQMWAAFVLNSRQLDQKSILISVLAPTIKISKGYPIVHHRLRLIPIKKSTCREQNIQNLSKNTHAHNRGRSASIKFLFKLGEVHRLQLSYRSASVSVSLALRSLRLQSSH